MTHEDAVRIANSGQGAIVSELRRLSDTVKAESDHVEKLQDDVAKYSDQVYDAKNLLRECLKWTIPSDSELAARIKEFIK